ncbi:hypothetical protein ACWGR4_30200 [Embleya sp. NPDC055664]
MYTRACKPVAERRHRLAVPNRAPWSLRIGPGGITTADNFHRTIAWDRIKTIGIEPVRPALLPELYVYPGLRVHLVDDTNATPLRPAGWFYSGEIPRIPAGRGGVSRCASSVH